MQYSGNVCAVEIGIPGLEFRLQAVGAPKRTANAGVNTSIAVALVSDGQKPHSLSQEML
jgi:hypothetical protein